MKARKVFENLNFKRKMDPKRSLGLGRIYPPYSMEFLDEIKGIPHIAKVEKKGGDKFYVKFIIEDSKYYFNSGFHYKSFDDARNSDVQDRVSITPNYIEWMIRI